MKYVENPKYGRKIFFLNPPLSIENVISVELKNKEFEVYIIHEYELAKPVLRKFPNAICWIFIDDILSYSAWCNFIKSFEYDEELKSIFIGVLTGRAKPKDQELFMLNTQLPGGFVRLDQKVEDTTNQLVGLLELNGARGVLKCIRLDLDSNRKNDVIAYFTNGNNMFSFQLREISPLGFSAITPAQMGKMFKKNTFIKNVSITLGRYSFTTTIQIYHAATIKNFCIVIATFADDTSPEIRKKIHDYVYQSLEYRYKVFCEGLSRDSTDYNINPTVGTNEPEEAVDAEEVKDSDGKSETKADENSKEKSDDNSEKKAEEKPADKTEEKKPEDSVTEKTDSEQPAQTDKTEAEKTAPETENKSDSKPAAEDKPKEK